ncbi:hypothetical protein [Flavobacterium sp. N3904]|uniref:hypothetical protein n=1 Tax=Flavobacterium sp. N3904 TaxID=2986835 RepID=UPI0022252DA0|nr:hypothetical protein [Flavobacterium sp. N3904]
MIIHLILHFIFGIQKRFFLGIGAITRWLLFLAYNILYIKKYSADLEYYIYNQNNKIDKNGFTGQNKNLFLGVIVFILTIVLMENYK